MAVYKGKQIMGRSFTFILSVILMIGLAVYAFIGLSACKVAKPEQNTELTYDPHSLDFANLTTEKWVSSENLQIVINSQGHQQTILTTGFRDYKPSWSKEGDRITFFRLIMDGPTFDLWKTKLCVINADGTDFNQTWTRDGSHLIIFNRYSMDGIGRNRIYLINPTGQMGDEQLVSDINQGFEWAYCGLKDGRIFIDRSNHQGYRSFLLTPDPGKIGKYEEIVRPTTLVWHKLSLSPSETKVCYMLDTGKSSSISYADSVLYYADFDINTLVVSNPVQITEFSMRYIDEYPRWSSDESLIVFDSNRSGVSQLYAYRLSDGLTRRISPNETMNYNFGNFEKIPK
jgi:hypothetical protein